VPGNDFGDHMEKMKHRVGVHLAATKAQKELIDGGLINDGRVETYATYDGDTFDAIVYDGDGDIIQTIEVETSSNNPQAVVEDYEKLAEAPGKSIWVFPNNPEFSDVWNILDQEVLEEEYSGREKKRVSNLRKQKPDFPERGVDNVRTYNDLTD